MVETQVGKKPPNVWKLLTVIEDGHVVWLMRQAEVVMGSSSGFLPLCALVPMSTGAAQSPLLVPGMSPPCSMSTASCPTPKHISPAGLSWLCIYSLWCQKKCVQADVRSRTKCPRSSFWMLKDNYSKYSKTCYEMCWMLMASMWQAGTVVSMLWSSAEDPDPDFMATFVEILG